MAGNWEFYWDKLYKYEDFNCVSENEKQYVYVPKTWDSYKIDENGLSGFGYATYRLKVIVSDTQQTLSLKLDNMSTSYRLFINEKEIASNGKVGRDKNTSIPNYRPMVVDFQPPSKEFFIIVQVSNFTYARGGMWYELNLGTHEQIAVLNSTIIYKDALLIGSLLIMALYYASFYFVLQRDKSSKYFMLLCIIFIIRTSIYGDALISRILPQIPFALLVFLTYSTLYWITVVIFLMVDSIYQSNFKFNFKKAFVLYGIVTTLLTAILPINIYTQFIALIEIIGILMVIFSLGIVVKAYIKKEKGAGLILFSVFAILLTGVHDILYQANVMHNSLGELASIGIFMFMFTFSFIIASRFSIAFEKSKRLSGQLEESLKKEKEASKELVKTELDFLKAQIKPHFIYNSLSVIAALTLDEPHKAKELLYNLTDYLRGSFNFENYSGLAPLADELETVKAYIAIEKARFQDKLKVKYCIDESVSILIPLLTIQPIVENAVRHGILKKPEGGTVILKIYRDATYVVISVEDDGIGIDSLKIESIMHGQASTNGVGLKNINRRLNLFYGAGLDIRSESHCGTVVTIRIPQEGACFE